MKCSKFIAVLLIGVMLCMMVQPAFASRTRTASEAVKKTAEDKAKKSLGKQVGKYVVDYGEDVYDIGKEVVKGNYGGAARVAATSVVNHTVTTPVATAAGTATMAALGITGTVATCGTVLIVGAACVGVRELISWIWP